MLRNPSSVLKGCASFALLQVHTLSLNIIQILCYTVKTNAPYMYMLFQFTIPGGRHAQHHVNLMQNAGAPRILRAAAAAAAAPLEAKIFAKIVLRNLEHHQTEPSILS